MFVHNYRGSILGLLAWQWRNLVAFVGAAAAAALVHHYAGDLFPKMSPLPVATMGGAVGIFVSFRTNSSYQRWWEGRQLWGRLVNTSRHLTTQALVYLQDRPEEARAVVRRQMAYVHVLRCKLRDQDPFVDPDVLACLTEEEVASLKGESNPNHALVQMQMEALVKLRREGVIDPETQRSFMSRRAPCSTSRAAASASRRRRSRGGTRSSRIG
ncbi:MAG: bestrophin family ion channel [Polyangiaceae bacterium]